MVARTNGGASGDSYDHRLKHRGRRSPAYRRKPSLSRATTTAASGDAEFQTLRDEIGVSDSVLSKHVKQLEEAGYIVQRKAALNGRQRTWVSLTGKGRKALAAHIAALKALAARAEGL